MKRLKQLYPLITPVLLATTFPLTLYSRNLSQIPVKQIILPTIVIIITTFLVSLTAKVLLHKNWKSVLATCITVIIFFTYTDVLAITGQSFVFRLLPMVSPSLQLFILNIVFLATLYIFIIKTRKNFEFLVKFLGVFSIITVFLPLFSITSYITSNRIHKQTSKLELPRVEALNPKTRLPDIYYIVPDYHAAAWIMKEQFGYDMTDFIDNLEKSGFHFFQQSTSNYPKTLLSLTSSLNMEYLDYLSTISSSDDETSVYPLIEDNNVLRFLKRLGYSYYQLGSWWIGTRANRLADKNIVIENEYIVSVDGFTYSLLSMTMIRPFITEHLSQFFLGESESDKLQRILYQFDKIEDVVHLPGPKFVFYHIIAPHSPYVLDKFCTAIAPAHSHMRPSTVNYAEQAECIDKKLTLMVETIQRASSNSAIIILQSDEGADLVGSDGRWNLVPPEAIQRKFPILNALYLPGIPSPNLPQTLTPVNTFRFIFNSYFQTNFPLLPNKNYIFQEHHPYSFTDVTEIVQTRVATAAGDWINTDMEFLKRN